MLKYNNGLQLTLFLRPPVKAWSFWRGLPRIGAFDTRNATNPNRWAAE